MAKPDTFRSWPRVWTVHISDGSPYSSVFGGMRRIGAVAWEDPVMISGDFGVFETGGMRYPYRIECLICGVVIDRIHYEHIETGYVRPRSHGFVCAGADLCQTEDCECWVCCDYGLEHDD